MLKEIVLDITDKDNVNVVLAKNFSSVKDTASLINKLRRIKSLNLDFYKEHLLNEEEDKYVELERRVEDAVREYAARLSRLPLHNLVSIGDLLPKTVSLNYHFSEKGLSTQKIINSEFKSLSAYANELETDDRNPLVLKCSTLIGNGLTIYECRTYNIKYQYNWNRKDARTADRLMAEVMNKLTGILQVPTFKKMYWDF